MEREIKFRVWDIGDKKFIENTGNPNIFPFNGKIGMTCNGNSTGHINTEDWIQESYILSQYTGLKDKNGVEIYEGDRILYSNSEETGEGIISYSCGFIIEWDLKTVRTTTPTIVSPLYYFQCSAEIEVIGNIYQNPSINIKDVADKTTLKD